MATQNDQFLIFSSDTRGTSAYVPGFPVNSFNFGINLLGGTAVSLTIPSSYQIWTMVVSIPSGSNLWVARNATAAAPVGNTFTNIDAQLNISPRRVYAGDTISFFSTANIPGMNVSLYAVTS